MTEFQSHEPEFDYLKSLEIEEKINKVRWCRSSNNTRMLLSTNDKTVKLWKVRMSPAAYFKIFERGYWAVVRVNWQFYNLRPYLLI